MKCGVIFNIPQRSIKLAELEATMAAPAFWNDQKAAKAVIDKASLQRAVLNPFKTLESRIHDTGVMIELVAMENDPAQAQQALAQIENDFKNIEKDFSKLEIESFFDGPFDQNNAYISIHAGAGGTEACDWADMLLRMYRRYCETHGFETNIMNILPGDEAGVKNVDLFVTGPFAYGYLSAERGVHRLVRISPFDANKRRHTSFASLDVIAELDEDFEVEILDADIRVDTYRSSGAGGQHVNKTDSAVRITHFPSGIVVACQTERSQHSNKMWATKMLKARLYEWKQDQKRKEMEKFYGEKGDIAWGRQIRSYVMQPYTLVKDHRTNYEKGNVAAVLDGDIEDFIEAYLKHKRAGISSETGKTKE